MAEGFGAWGKFMPGLFPRLGKALRSAWTEQERDSAAPPGTTGRLGGRDDEIDVSFDERALGNDLLQELGLAVGEGIPGGGVLPICSRLGEQVLDVGRQVLSPVAHQDLQGKRQGFDERREALNDGFLLVRRFE